MTSLSSTAPAGAQPSATVVLLRDRSDGFELLLLRRSRTLSVHGGQWVFPGGRVDPQDHTPEDSGDDLAASRRAAVREVAEEAGIELAVDDLVPHARWITPEIRPKRFDAWFFLAPAGDVAVEIDGGEIDAYRWLTPAMALAEQAARTLEIPPPTFVTITKLAAFASAAEAISDAAARPPVIHTPKICMVEGGACSLYEGDAGYDDLDYERSGPRHRLWIVDSGWRYECRDG
jgi:8-oxo-dGTP pyrophosphatase MutT (NUDIX family)